MLLLPRMGAIALALFSSAALADPLVLPQVKNAANQNVPSQAAVLTGTDGIEKGTNTNPLVTIGKQESFQLMKADVAVLSATVAGGDYALSQTCTAYGTLNLQVLGPDGSTWQTLITKSASDTAGATGLSLGSYATVRIATTGATGCNAILARIPA